MKHSVLFIFSSLYTQKKSKRKRIYFGLCEGEWDRNGDRKKKKIAVFVRFVFTAPQWKLPDLSLILSMCVFLYFRANKMVLLKAGYEIFNRFEFWVTNLTLKIWTQNFRIKFMLKSSIKMLFKVFKLREKLAKNHAK